jgi:TP901 family phage tail tape measure protein
MAGLLLEFETSGLESLDSANRRVNAATSGANALTLRMLEAAKATEQLDKTARALSEAPAAHPGGTSLGAQTSQETVDGQISKAINEKSMAWSNLQKKVYATTLELDRWTQAVRALSGTQELELRELNATSAAYEKQRRAEIDAVAANQEYSAAMHASATASKLDLEAKQASITNAANLVRAIRSVSAETERLQNSEYREMLAQKVANEAEAKKITLLAREKVELAALVAAQESYTSGTAGQLANQRLLTQEAKKTASETTQRQIADRDLRREIDYLSSTEGKHTLVLQEELSALKASARAHREKKDAAASEIASATALTQAERNSIAVAREAERLYNEKARLLARASFAVKQLAAENAALARSEAASSAASQRSALHLNLMAQAAAAARSSLYGLGASFGMYTSATILVASAGYAISRGLREAVSAGMDYEEELAKLGAVATDAALGSAQYAKSLANLDKASRDVAYGTKFQAIEVAKAMEQMVLAGLTEQEAISGVRDVMNLAIVGTMDFGKATEIAVHVMRGFGMGVAELPRIVDVLTKAAIDSTTTVEGLGVAMSYAAPISGAFGISLEYTAAAVMALSNAGISQSKAGTGWRRAILGLFAPTRTAADAFKDLGINAKESGEALQDLEGMEGNLTGIVANAGDGTQKLANRLKELYIATAGGTEGLDKLKTIAGIYGYQSLVYLIRSQDLATNSVDSFAASLLRAAGIAEQTKQKMVDNAKAEFDALKSAADQASLIAFDSEKTGIRQLITDITGWLRVLAASPEKIAAFVDSLKALALILFEVAKAFALFKAAVLAMGVLGFLISHLKQLWAIMTAVYTATAASSGMLMANSVALFRVSEGALAAVVSFTALKAAFRGLLIATGVGAVLVGIGYAVEWLADKFFGLNDIVGSVGKVMKDLDANSSNARAENIAKANELLEGGLSKLLEEKRHQEELLSTLKSQGEELTEANLQYDAINKKLSEAQNILARYRSTDLFLEKSDLERKKRELEKQVEEKRNDAQSKWYDPLFVEAGGAEKRKSNANVELDKELAKLAQVNAALGAVDQKSALLGQSIDGIAIDLTGMATSAAGTLQQYKLELEDTLTKVKELDRQKELGKVSPDNYDSQRASLETLVSLQDAAVIRQQENVSRLQQAQQAQARIEKASIAEIARAHDNAAQVQQDEIDLAKMSEEARHAKVIENIQKELVALRKKKDEADAIYAAELEWATRAETDPNTGKGIGPHQDLMTAARQVNEVNLQIKEHEVALAKEIPKAAKSVAGADKAYLDLTKTIIGLYKAKEALIKQGLDNTRAYEDETNRIYNRGEAYQYQLDTINAVSRAATTTRISGTNLSGSASEAASSARPLGTTELRAMAERTAAKYNIDFELMDRMITHESSWNPTATGPTNDHGLGQFTPATGARYGLNTVAQMNDPALALDAVARLLSDLLTRYGNPQSAAAGYNGSITRTGQPTNPNYISWTVGANSRAYPGTPYTGTGWADGASGVAAGSSRRQTEATTRGLKEEQAQLVLTSIEEKRRAEILKGVGVEQTARVSELDKLTAGIEEQRKAEQEYLVQLGLAKHFEDMRRSGTQLDEAETAAEKKILEDVAAAYKLYNSKLVDNLELEDKLVANGTLRQRLMSLDEKQMLALSRSVGTVRSAQDTYNQSQVAYRNLLNANFIGQEEFIRLIDRAKTALENAKGPWESFFQTMRYSTEDLQKIGVEAFGKFRDVLVDALTTGKLKFDDFITYIKRKLAEMAVNTILVNFVGTTTMSAAAGSATAAAGQAVTGTGTASATGGGSALSSLGSIGSFLGSSSMGASAAAYTAKAYGSLFGTGASQSFGNGVANLANTSNLTLGAGALAGGLLGSAVFGGKGYGSAGASVGSTVGAFAGSLIPIPVVGTLIGGAIGGLLGGALGSLFGGGKSKEERLKEQQARAAEQIKTAVGPANDAITAANAALAAKSFKDAEAYLAQSKAAVVAASEAGKAHPHDESTAAVLSASKAYNDALDQINATKAAITAALPGMVAVFAAAGQSLGENAMEAAQHLMTLAGSFDNLSTLVSNFNSKFTSQSAQEAAQLSSLTSALSALGLAIPENRDGFRALVQAQDLATESGRNAYVALLGLTDAMDGFYTSVEATRAAMAQAQATYSAAFWTETEQAAVRRTEATTAMASLGFGLPTDRAGYRALVESQPADTEAGRAAYQALINLAPQMDAVYKDVEASNERITAANDAAAQASNSLASSASSAASQVSNLADSLQEWVRKLRGDLAASNGAGLAYTQAQYKEQLSLAKKGDEKALGSLTGYADSYLSEAKKGAATLVEYSLTAAKVAAEVERVANSRKTVEAASVRNSSTSTSTSTVSQAQTELAAMDAALKSSAVASAQAAAQVQAVETARLAAVAQERQVQAAAQAQATASAAAAQAAADAAAASATQAAAAAQAGSWEYMQAWFDTLGLAQNGGVGYSVVGASFADGGIASGPLSGYPVTLHGTEAVIPLKDGAVPVQLSYEELIAEIKALRTDVRSTGAEQTKLQQKTAAVLQKFDIDGMPGVRT